MREDHECSKLIPLGARPAAGPTQREKGLAALEKLRAWGARQKAASLPKASSLGFRLPSSTNSAASRASALTALQKAAKGDDKIPAEKRIYLHVEASADTTTAKFPTGSFFYNKEWSVGRVLDVAAKALQVQNVNNHGGGETEKLRVFHVEGGRLLEFSEKLGQSVQSGNTLVLLRGVGPPVPDLIQP